MTAINTNESVWVRLTPYGGQVFDSYYLDLGLNPTTYHDVYVCGDGWYSFQLWELLSMFGGPSVYLGGPIPFEGNVIHLTNPLDIESSTD